MKKLLYIDMDGVTADFDKKMAEICPELFLGDGEDYEERSKKVSAVLEQNFNFFLDLEPIEDAIESINLLFDKYDIYFLSTPVYEVPKSYSDKRLWLEKYFGEKAIKRLILTHRKDLNIGDYLIDDRTKNGAGEFKGELIQFGTEKYPDWKSIINKLL